MYTIRDLVMLASLAAVLLFGTACFRLFAGSDEPAKDAEVAACAGLSGAARAECEARHAEQ